MSRYVEHKHGITIGSADNFFFVDQDGNTQDFPCILWAKRYYFDHINSVNTFVRTPAQQIIWSEIAEKQPVEVRGKIIAQIDRTRLELSQWARTYLERNAPGFAVAPSRFDDDSPSIFFAKRRHAVAFAREIALLLEGMHFG